MNFDSRAAASQDPLRRVYSVWSHGDKLGFAHGKFLP